MFLGFNFPGKTIKTCEMDSVVTVRKEDPERDTANQSVALGPLQLIIPVLQKRHTGRQGKDWPFYDVSLFALNSSQ